MKFENTEVWGFRHAIRGMRNPHESWEKSDSWVDMFGKTCRIGKNDMRLMQSLIKAGSEHRKFMRQIFVSVDITAPLYWWKETDQYKIGTVSDSCSTMHKLASTPITIECFEMDDFEEVNIFKKINSQDEWETSINVWGALIPHLERLRTKYNETKDKRYWKELIRLLPGSWLQKRTITMSYENVLNMVRQRKNHKLTEWSKSFIDWARTLPYAQELIFLDEISEKSGQKLIKEADKFIKENSYATCENRVPGNPMSDSIAVWHEPSAKMSFVEGFKRGQNKTEQNRTAYRSKGNHQGFA